MPKITYFPKKSNTQYYQPYLKKLYIPTKKSNRLENMKNVFNKIEKYTVCKPADFAKIRYLT